MMANPNTNEDHFVIDDKIYTWNLQGKTCTVNFDEVVTKLCYLSYSAPSLTFGMGEGITLISYPRGASVEVSENNGEVSVHMFKRNLSGLVDGRIYCVEEFPHIVTSCIAP